MFNLNFIKKFILFDKDQEPELLNLPGGPVKQSSRVVVTLSAALIVVAGLAFYFWYENNQEPNQAKKEPQSEVQELVAEISQFLILPTDEEPTVATVSDLEKLKDQPFFVGAKAGDKVLIYANAKKAILYDPIARKIINVAPINIGNNRGL